MNRNYLAVIFLTLSVLFSYGALLYSPVTHKLIEYLIYWSYGNLVIKHNILTFSQFGLWDIFNGAGQPLAPYITSLFYPPTIISFFLPDLYAIRFVTILHLVGSTLVIFYILRAFKVDVFPSIIGAFSYMVNPYMPIYLTTGGLSDVINYVWMPLTIAFLWKGVFGKKKHLVVLAGVALAMHIISMVLYALYFTFVIVFLFYIYYLVYETVVRKSPIRKTLITTFVSCMILFGVCVALSAIKLFPILEYKTLSMRDVIPPYPEGFSDTFTLRETVKEFLKYFTQRYGPYVGYFSPGNAIFFILVAAGCIGSVVKKSRFGIFVTTLLIVSIWAFMNKHVPINLYEFFRAIIPGMNTQQVVFRYAILVNFAFSLIAGYGAYYVFRLIKIRSKFFAYLIIIALGWIVIQERALVTHTYMHNEYFKRHELSQRVEQNSKTNINKIVKEEIKEDSKLYKVASTYGIKDQEVYNLSAFDAGFSLSDPLHYNYTVTYKFFPFEKALTDEDSIRKKYTLLRLLNTKYLVTEKRFEDAPNPYAKKIRDISEGSIYSIHNPLAFISEAKNSLLLFDNDTFRDFNAYKAKALVLNPKFDIAKTSVFTTPNKISDYSVAELKRFDLIVVTKEYEDQYREYISTLKQQKVNITVTYYSQNKYDDIRERSKSVLFPTTKQALYLNDKESERFGSVLDSMQLDKKNNDYSLVSSNITPEVFEFTVKTDRKNTFIRIADTYYPGWEAYINGKKAEIYMADGMNKGIVLDGPGTYEISFFFRPWSFYVGAAISFLALVSVAYYLYKRLMKKRKKS